MQFYLYTMNALLSCLLLLDECNALNTALSEVLLQLLLFIQISVGFYLLYLNSFSPHFYSICF
jgi:hypothetical protein